MINIRFYGCVPSALDDEIISSRPDEDCYQSGYFKLIEMWGHI